MNYLRKNRGITLTVIVILVILILILSSRLVYIINFEFFSKKTNEPLATQVSSIAINNQTNNTTINQPIQFDYNSLLNPDGSIAFDDVNLENTIKNQLGIFAKEIFPEDIGWVTALDITNCNIKSLNGIQYFKNLEVLTILDNCINNLEPLKYLINLEHLTISDDCINNLEPLKYLINLEYLTISGDCINNLEPLKYLINLEYLTISDDCINNLEPLKYLINLEQLCLNHNAIVDISPLSGLNKLTYLSLAYNLIKDITPLGQLTNLQTLDLSNNRITDISIINNIASTLTQFPMLKSNPIMDYSPIINNFDKIFNNWINAPDTVALTLSQTEIDLHRTDFKNMYNDYQTAITKIKSVYKSIITDNMNDLQKEYAIVNYLMGQITYDYDLADFVTQPPNTANCADNSFNMYYITGDFNHPDIYRSFILGTGICDTYAISFLYLATMAGLDSYYVYSDLSDVTIGEISSIIRHAWNIVKINDNYYQVDVTWADQAIYDYLFINISDKTMTNQHSSDNLLLADKYKYPATDIDMPVSMQQMYYEQ